MNNSSLLADVSGIPYFCFKKMRKYLLSLALVVGVVSMNAQEKVTIWKIKNQLFVLSILNGKEEL